MTSVKQKAGVAGLGAALLFGLSWAPAHAAYVVRFEQQADNAVATGSGSVDLTGLTIGGSGPFAPSLSATGATFVTGPTGFSSVDVYSGFGGPANFGNSNGGSAHPDSGSGDIVGVLGVDGTLVVPAGYDSSNPLSSMSTYLNTTFADLGVTPGTYVWTWGTGANQNFTLMIGAGPGPGPNPAPEPASAALIGMALAALVLAGTVHRLRHALRWSLVICERPCPGSLPEMVLRA